MRSFVLGDEAAVLMCTYEPGDRPTRPFPYFSEVMTGFEYTVATGLLQVGAIKEGLEIIRAIRDRYDGARRNPFDEAECGHHYARAMASWSAFATWNDVWYDGRRRELEIGSRSSAARRFWSTGSAFGTWERETGDALGTLRVVRGELALDSVVVDGLRRRGPAEVLTAETSWTVSTERD
jgi:non-lysosomal glucosylceramidase